MDHVYHWLHTRGHVQKKKAVKKSIAFFDFDGTITTKDTLLEFIRFSKGNFKFFVGFLLNVPYLVAYKMKIISNQTAKEKILGFFFKNTPVDKFSELCSSFSKNILPKLIRSKALEEIRKLEGQGFLIVVVSASPQNWIQSWAGETGVELIASCLEVKEEKLTGKLLGRNCHGEEKVRRISEKHIIANYDTIYAYGDTSGDLPMLKLATSAFYRPFRK